MFSTFGIQLLMAVLITAALSSPFLLYHWSFGWKSRLIVAAVFTGIFFAVIAVRMDIEMAQVLSGMILVAYAAGEAFRALVDRWSAPVGLHELKVDVTNLFTDDERDVLIRHPRLPVLMLDCANPIRDIRV